MTDPSLVVNGKSLLISRERVVRGRLALVMIAIISIEYCVFLIPWSLVLLLVPSVRVRRLFRRWQSTVQLLLLGFIGYVVEFVCTVRLVITGADELLHVIPSKPMIMSNHRCELDWLFLVCLSLRLHRLSVLKIPAWEEISQLPFIGWLSQVFLFPSLCGRDKVKDLATIRNTVEYLTGIQHPMGVSVGVFPEGSSVSEQRALEKSQRYSEEILGILPPWKRVLVPRAPGMYETVRSLNRLNALDSVIDVTIGYLDFSPFEMSSFASFWAGTYPREVHMHLDYLRWVEIPTDFDSMKDWLVDRFAKKEKLLDKFYSPIELMYHHPIRRMDSTTSSADSVSSQDSDDGQRSENTDQLSTTSTHLSNLAALVAFSGEDGESPEPAEETLSKDMRFIQYISNSYVISAAVAMMVNCLVVVGIMSYPKQVLLYVLGVCLMFSLVTRWIGGFNVLEMDIVPVQVDLTYSSEYYSSADPHGYRPQGFLQSLKDFFTPGKRGDAAEYAQRDKENYIEALRRRRMARRQ
jgi:1-acyl-sn-glycerol-3-phosphate acyltransferase